MPSSVGARVLVAKVSGESARTFFKNESTQVFISPRSLIEAPESYILPDEATSCGTPDAFMARRDSIIFVAVATRVALPTPRSRNLKPTWMHRASTRNSGFPFGINEHSSFLGPDHETSRPYFLSANNRRFPIRTSMDSGEGALEGLEPPGFPTPSAPSGPP